MSKKLSETMGREIEISRRKRKGSLEIQALAENLSQPLTVLGQFVLTWAHVYIHLTWY